MGDEHEQECVIAPYTLTTPPVVPPNSIWLTAFLCFVWRYVVTWDEWYSRKAGRKASRWTFSPLQVANIKAVEELLVKAYIT